MGRYVLDGGRCVGQREREQPSEKRPGAWRTLCTAVRPPEANFADLGQFVALWMEAGRDEAARVFPAVAAHLATGCAACSAAADEVKAALAADAER